MTIVLISSMCITALSLWNTACDFAFPVVSTFAHTNIALGHAEALVCSDVTTALVQEHVCRGVLEIQSGSEGFAFGLTIIEGGWESRICNAMGVMEVLLVVDTETVSNALQQN